MPQPYGLHDITAFKGFDPAEGPPPRAAQPHH